MIIINLTLSQINSQYKTKIFVYLFIYFFNKNSNLLLIRWTVQDLHIENKGQDPPFSKPEGSGLINSC